LLITKKISYGVLLFFLTFIFVIKTNAQSNSSNLNSTTSTDTSNQIFALESIPANSIYQGKWDNNYIKVYKNLLPNKPDSLLILFNGIENFFTIPCTDGKIMSQFGFRGRRVHSGVDIRQKTGSPIVSAFDGKVRLAKYSHGYGNVIVIRHYNGLETVYAHLSKIKVKVNQDVKSGELIGLAGSTGHATASHLHFETRFLGEAFNPEKIIDFEANKLRQDTFEIKPATFIVDQSARIGGYKIDTTVSDSSNNTNHVVPKIASHHTIKKGDTLYSLAKNNGTTVQAVCKLNHITPKTKLKVGRVIRLR
jgi:murein DD-endopeptidase MepM/ murein hydrolase activator NlpD